MDPLTEVISLLQPRQVTAKAIHGAGNWAIRYEAFGQPGFCVVLEGQCQLAVAEQPALTLQAGDFVLLPATPEFTLWGGDEPMPVLRATDAVAAARAMTDTSFTTHHGDPDAPADVRLLGGYCQFGGADAALLVSLLPAQMLVRQQPRLALYVRLINEECQLAQAGQALVLRRLVEVLFIEALRATTSNSAPTGLLRGLADERVALALREIHRDPARNWTVAAMASLAALSRTSFFARFRHTLGLQPMEYLLRWRMALAKDLLCQSGLGLSEIACKVGYQSASAFSTAFSRHVGLAPGLFARQQQHKQP